LHVSTWIVPFLAVLPVTNLLPHEQVTSVTPYCGWMPFFTMVLSGRGRRVAVTAAPDLSRRDSGVNRNLARCETGPEY
jgi:hypothetical protein